jgi:hypothetical protein
MFRTNRGQLTHVRDGPPFNEQQSRKSADWRDGCTVHKKCSQGKHDGHVGEQRGSNAETALQFIQEMCRIKKLAN